MSKQDKRRRRIISQSLDVDGFFTELNESNDRTTAILLAAYLDETLRQVFDSYLVADDPKL